MSDMNQPSMNFDEICMLLTLHLQEKHKTPIAVLADMKNITVIDFSGSTFTGATHIVFTPIVNLLMVNDVKMFTSKDIYIFTSAPPGQACLGMAKLIGIEKIFFLLPGRSEIRVFTFVKDEPVPKLDEYTSNVWPSSISQSGPITPQRASTKLLEFLRLSRPYASAQTAAFRSSLCMFQAVHTEEFVIHESPMKKVAGVTPKFRDILFLSLIQVLVVFTWNPGDKKDDPRLPNQRKLFDEELKEGKNVACVLVNADNQIIGWGVNTNYGAPTRHSETNAVIAYQAVTGRPLPPNTTLYASLEPCWMCAGVFVHAGGSRCVYDMADPNMSGKTALRDIECKSGKELFTEDFLGTEMLEGQRDDPSTMTAAIGKPTQQKAMPSTIYLGTDSALVLYSRAFQRLINCHKYAKNLADNELHDQVLRVFLRSIPRFATLLENPHLMLDDEMPAIIFCRTFEEEQRLAEEEKKREAEKQKQEKARKQAVLLRQPAVVERGVKRAVALAVALENPPGNPPLRPQ